MLVLHRQARGREETGELHKYRYRSERNRSITNACPVSCSRTKKVLPVAQNKDFVRRRLGKSSVRQMFMVDNAIADYPLFSNVDHSSPTSPASTQPRRPSQREIWCQSERVSRICTSAPCFRTKCSVPVSDGSKRMGCSPWGRTTAWRCQSSTNSWRASELLSTMNTPIRLTAVYTSQRGRRGHSR